jgi:phage terminase large subunit
MAKIDGSKNLKVLLDNKKPIVVLEGSSRSTKTFSIIQYFILACLENKKHIHRSFRAEQTVCRKTLIPDFMEIMATSFPELSMKSWNKQEACYTFPNGSQFLFDGCDTGKLHGMRQDSAHLNEVMEFPYSAWTQIAARTTGLKVFDFNPSLTHHFVFSTILTRDEKEFTYNHSTYKDNKHLSSEQVGEIEGWEPNAVNDRAGTSDQWLWDVYGLGKRGRRQGAIYKRWQITEKWPDRWACQRWGYGLDFGFSVDPTALIECCLFQDNVYLRQRIYQTGLVATRSESNPRIPCIQNHYEELDIDKNAKQYADSARPDSIAELAGVGWNVIPTHKGRDSVNSGIQRLQRFNLQVHISSQDLQIELENYSWMMDRATEEIKDVPEDKFNHGLDAARYWAMEELEPVRPIRERALPNQPIEPYNPFGVLVSG